MSTRYLIDTNVWSALIRRRDAALATGISALRTDQVMLSPVVLGELIVGYYKGDQTPARRAVIDQIMGAATHLHITPAVSETYARLRATLEQAGTPIGRNDTWIAAEALHEQLILVTGNLREFELVPALRVENWLHDA